MPLFPLSRFLSQIERGNTASLSLSHTHILFLSPFFSLLHLSQSSLSLFLSLSFLTHTLSFFLFNIPSFMESHSQHLPFSHIFNYSKMYISFSLLSISSLTSIPSSILLQPPPLSSHSSYCLRQPYFTLSLFFLSSVIFLSHSLSPLSFPLSHKYSLNSLSPPLFLSHSLHFFSVVNVATSPSLPPIT